MIFDRLWKVDTLKVGESVEFIISLLPMAVLFGVMYFLLIRPQKKVADKKKEMISAIKPGDHVVTIGGLHGIIEEVNNIEGIVVLDCEGVYLTFELAAVSTVKESVAGNGTAVDALSPEVEVTNIDEAEALEFDEDYETTEFEEH